MTSLLQRDRLYKSFWMGGFEGADHINGNQHKLDMVRDSGHLDHVAEDYAKISALGIQTIRESIGWRTVQPRQCDNLNFSRTVKFARLAYEKEIQLIWTFMHYGTPEGVSLFDDSFIDYFTYYAARCAMALKPFSIGAPIFNLINETSFLAWAVSQTNQVYPYVGSGNNREGFEVKCRLVRAILKAMDAVRDVCPDARFLHVEPILHIVAPQDRPDLEDLALEVRGHQWQTWELLRGTMEPALGGYPAALDLMGVNYYYNGQMEVETGTYLDWEKPDPRRLPFSELLKEVWTRYERPLIISETGHFGDSRSKWLSSVFDEALLAIRKGVPLQGLCIYPIVDRPCWHEPSKLIRCGLIEAERKEHDTSVKTLRFWQSKLQEGLLAA